MKDGRPTQSSADELAMRWIRMLPGGSQAVHRAFAYWLTCSPRHVEAYLRQKGLDAVLSEIDTTRRIDVQVLVAKAKAENRKTGNVIRWSGWDDTPPDALRYSAHNRFTLLRVIAILAGAAL